MPPAVTAAADGSADRDEDFPRGFDTRVAPVRAESPVPGDLPRTAS